MSLTAYHAKLFAQQLTKRSASDSVDTGSPLQLLKSFH